MTLLVGPAVGELGIELRSSFDFDKDPLPDPCDGGSVLKDNLKVKARLTSLVDTNNIYQTPMSCMYSTDIM